MKKVTGILIVFMLVIASFIVFASGSTVSEKISQPLTKNPMIILQGSERK